MIRVRALLAAFLAVFLIAGVGAEIVLENAARQVLTALRDKDLDKLSSLVHPTKGVRFSPQEIVTGKDRIFIAAAVRDHKHNETIYAWGSYAGSGEQIRLTFKAYLEQFAYDQDYANSKIIGFHTTMGRQEGHHSASNLGTAYNGAYWLEYYFPPETGSKRWHSLWLVFEKFKGQFYLVGIVHGEGSP